MKRLVLLGVLIFSFAATAAADEITFSFVIGGPGSLTASAAGLTTGPAANVLVTDVTKGISVPLLGTFTASAGPAASFVVLPPIILANYTHGGANSVLIVDPANNPLVRGTMNDNGLLLVSFPHGAGAFLAGFNVAFVSPTVLALFGQGGFQPGGSVALTYANDNFDGTTVTGTLGGGTVTVTTNPIPEPASLGLLGMGLLTIAGLSRKWASRARGL
jgi:hypothetical protein